MSVAGIHFIPIMGMINGLRSLRYSLGVALATVTIVFGSGTSVVQAGGEVQSGESKGWFRSKPRVQESATPSRPRFQLPRLIHPGNNRTHRRPIGWGSSLNPYYGPTYYYPSTNNYRASNPTYYPFFQERLWPNYKSEPPSRNVSLFSFLRKQEEAPKVDDYDRFKREGRYGERQWNR
jgi:hypothetical protein